MAALSSDMASKVDALDKGSVAKFQTRADAVFRNLGPEDVQVRPEASSSWQLKKEQVFRSGKEAEDASSEEEAEDPAQQLITGLQSFTQPLIRFCQSSAGCHKNLTLARRAEKAIANDSSVDTKSPKHAMHAYHASAILSSSQVRQQYVGTI